MKIVRAVEARSSSALKRSSTFDDAICVRGARMADPLAKQSAEERLPVPTCQPSEPFQQNIMNLSTLSKEGSSSPKHTTPAVQLSNTQEHCKRTGRWGTRWGTQVDITEASNVLQKPAGLT